MSDLSKRLHKVMKDYNPDTCFFCLQEPEYKDRVGCADLGVLCCDGCMDEMYKFARDPEKNGRRGKLVPRAVALMAIYDDRLRRIGK